MSKKLNVSYIVKIAVLSAISTIIMLFEIPLWFAPPFYKLDLSEVAVLIGGFALGPLAAVLIEAVKILINFIVDGTITFGIGEAANLILGCAFALPAAIIYKHKKSFRSAVIGLSIGTISLAVLGGIINLYVLLPIYAYVFKMPMDAFVGMGNAVNKNITNIYSFILLATVPFNLFKGVVCSIITLLLYKRISKILHK